jgi:hypothetical protein
MKSKTKKYKISEKNVISGLSIIKNANDGGLKFEIFAGFLPDCTASFSLRI